MRKLSCLIASSLALLVCWRATKGNISKIVDLIAARGGASAKKTEILVGARRRKGINFDGERFA